MKTPKVRSNKRKTVIRDKSGSKASGQKTKGRTVEYKKGKKAGSSKSVASLKTKNKKKITTKNVTSKSGTRLIATNSRKGPMDVVLMSKKPAKTSSGTVSTRKGKKNVKKTMRKILKNR